MLGIIFFITPVRKAEQTDHSDQVNDGPNHESESQNALASGPSDKGNDQKHDRKQQKPKGNKAKKADNEIKKGSCHGSGV